MSRRPSDSRKREPGRGSIGRNDADAQPRKRSATSTIGEGEDRIVARRRGSKLDLTIGDRNAAHIRAKMSWGIAECLLGRNTTLEEALGSGAITVKLTTETGTSVQAVLH